MKLAFWIAAGLNFAWYLWAYMHDRIGAWYFFFVAWLPAILTYIASGLVDYYFPKSVPVPETTSTPSLPEPTIPRHIRAEHCLILGSTGSGKTSLLEKLIYADIETDATVVVMTLKGSLIPNLERLQRISPERLVYFGPNHLIPLNPFALPDSTSAVDLIRQVFSSSDPTPKQNTLLSYCIRLLLKSKGTLRDLRTLMKSPTLPNEYKQFVSELSQSGQEFFREQFAAKDYAETKQQMMWRLDMLLESPLIERLFCQPHNALNMSQVFENGKIVLLDTSAKQFGESGSAFVGRFFLALITLAAQQRDKPTRPVYVYIDEASTYLTPNVETILERAREAKVGLTLAIQQLDQLGTLQASVLTNTSTKIIGRCSETDARRLTSTMQVEKHTYIEHQPPLHFLLKIPQSPVRSLDVIPGYLKRFEQREIHREHGEHSTPLHPAKTVDKIDSEDPSQW